jgi:PAS domain S-box-containing protein
MQINEVRAGKHGLGGGSSGSIFTFVLTVLTGLSLTALLFDYFVQQDKQRVTAHLRRGVETLSYFASQPVLDPLIIELARVLTSVQSDLYAGTPLSQELLDKWRWQEAPPGLEFASLEYLPRVAQAGVDTFSAGLATNENSGFPIVEQGSDGLVPAAPRAEYFPVLFESYPERPRAVIGLDRSGDPLQKLAIEQARDTGMITVFTSFPLAIHDEHELLSYYYLPVYDSGATPANVDERRERFAGLIAVVSYVPSRDLFTFLADSFQGLDAVYFPHLPEFDSAPAYAGLRQELQRGTLVTQPYLAQGISFQVIARASAALAATLMTSTRWWVLSIGLLLTTWMGSMVLWFRSRSQRILTLVRERTRDLDERTAALSAANDALRESEMRYRMLADNASDVIYTCDLDGNYTYISPSVKQQRGYEVSELAGLPVTTWLPEKSARAILARLELARRTVSGGLPLPDCTDNKFEFESYSKDGTVKWLETTVSFLLDPAGRPSGILGVSRDISERKATECEREALEDTYRQAQKMEAIGTLAGGIAHDFNNLLTGIFGYTELLRLQVKNNPDADESIGVIEMAANRARELTSKLLGFARRGRLQAVAVDLNETVLEVQALLRSTVDKRIEISVRLDPRSTVVIGDPGQLSHLFLNLGINARDAMPEGGKLNFETAIVELDEGFCRTHPGLVPGTYNRVAVMDTGKGIDKDKLPRIFEPFFTDKEQGKGTGLGLAMVYGVASSHGGIVQVHSEPGKGSTFEVYLPFSERRKTARKTRTKAARTVQGSGTIMVVDDEAMIRELASNQLGNLGYSVILAEDGAAALDLYREKWRDIDVVIVDMIMPTLGGRECIAGLRAINPDVKVILATGYSREALADKIDKAGIFGFLPKPFRQQQLAALVAEALGVQE